MLCSCLPDITTHMLEKLEPETSLWFQFGKQLKWIFLTNREETNQFPHALNKILMHGGETLIVSKERHLLFLLF